MAVKTKMAVEQGMNVLVGLGESSITCRGQLAFNVCQSTLSALKSIERRRERRLIGKISGVQWKQIAIHYEPQWTTETDNVAGPDEVQQIHETIRDWINDNVSPEIASAVRIVYGGSVNEHNFSGLLEQKDVDGLIV